MRRLSLFEQQKGEWILKGVVRVRKDAIGNKYIVFRIGRRVFGIW